MTRNACHLLIKEETMTMRTMMTRMMMTAITTPSDLKIMKKMKENVMVIN